MAKQEKLNINGNQPERKKKTLYVGNMRYKVGMTDYQNW